MLGRQRLYFMLPDVLGARRILDELLLARIEIRHMRFWAKDSTLPEDMPDASFWHKTDLTHGAQNGMIIGGLIGFLGGIWLVFFPPSWIYLPPLAILATTAIGLTLGGWMSGMAAVALPNSRLANFQEGIESGKVLLIVDVPYQRVGAIEALIEKRYPEAKFGGVESHIPVFP